jgi:hypothetical protein
MSWEDEDTLDESWLPAWHGDEDVKPEKAPPEQKPDPEPPDNDPATDMADPPGIDCRVNLALWWLALLQDGPPPEGDWVEFYDKWDGPPTIGGTMFPIDFQDEDVLDKFRERDGGDFEC